MIYAICTRKKGQRKWKAITIMFDETAALEQHMRLKEIADEHTEYAVISFEREGDIPKSML